MRMAIRAAQMRDYAAMLAIYRPYVTGTVVTFEYDVPTLETFASRLDGYAAQFPVLVCVIDGVIAGYAYASPAFERAGYRWDADLSIYVQGAFQEKGIGMALYASLLALLKLQGYRNVYACISAENPRSLQWHAKRGFAQVGRFPQCGFKMGQWHDVIWMAKCIGAMEGEPADPIAFSNLPQQQVEACYLCGLAKTAL
nr:GNAT family N-acetyltransferase [Maliibacterium massiliense]